MCGKHHNTFKSYMDYRKITCKASSQYKLIHSDEVYVGDDGLLYSDGYIGAALGSRFGKVGDKFILTMSSGDQVKIILLDIKDDSDTYKKCHHMSDGSLIEFVVDVNKLKGYYPTAAKMGDLNYISKLSGDVVQIDKVLY